MYVKKNKSVLIKPLIVFNDYVSSHSLKRASLFNIKFRSFKIIQMSQYNDSRSPDNIYIARLPSELILYGLLDLLEDKDQQRLSWTCKWLYRFVRMNRFGIVSPIWEVAEIKDSEILSSSSCYRDGAVINNVLYIPI